MNRMFAIAVAAARSARRQTTEIGTSPKCRRKGESAAAAFGQPAAPPILAAGNASPVRTGGRTARSGPAPHATTESDHAAAIALRCEFAAFIVASIAAADPSRHLSRR